MKATGDSYQRALAAVTGRPHRRAAGIDLVHFTSFGRPMALATFAGDAVDTFAVFGAASRSAAPSSLSLPAMWFLRPEGLN